MFQAQILPDDGLTVDDAVSRVGFALIIGGAEIIMSNSQIWQPARDAVHKWGPDEAVAQSAKILLGPKG